MAIKTEDIASLRREYSQKELDPSDCLPDPCAQFNLWLDQALTAQINEPTAMHLATVTAEGRPSARIVLLKGLEQGRFIFFSNYLSRKGEQLSAQPWAALTFFWPELERQVRIEGRVQRVSEAESDAYFASRPYTSRIGAWASEQSRELDSKTTLMQRAAMFAARHVTGVPRPQHWGGYALLPERMEFWQGRPSRLHDRVLYLPDAEGGWARSRLYP